MRDIVREMAIKIGTRDYLRRHPGVDPAKAKAWATLHRLRYMDMALDALALLLATEEEKEGIKDSIP